MKTLGEFKESGLEFVEGDERSSIHKGHGNVQMTKEMAFGTNKDDKTDRETVISFAWRENTGVKPEFKGLIEVELKDGTVMHPRKSSEFMWALKLSGFSETRSIVKWRPSLNQPSSETDTKESAIHKAWVVLRGDLKNLCNYSASTNKDGYILHTESSIDWPISMPSGYYFSESKPFDDSTSFSYVCKVSEFTDYCEKMAAEEKRMNIIGQNGNDGLHYDNTAQQVEALAINDKPIFTQAMADNGELPPVGSEVSLRYKFDSKQIHITGTVLYSSLEHCIIDGKHKECHYKMCDYIYEAVDTRTEREKVIEDMLKLFKKDDIRIVVYETAAEVFFDAGYRKC